MAREIVIWCDRCWGKDKRTPALEHSLGILLNTVRAVPTKTIALCDDCVAELGILALAELLEEEGMPLEAPAPKAAKKAAAAGSTRVAAQVKGAPNTEQTLLLFESGGTRKGKPPRGPRGNECLWCPLTYSNDGGGFGRHLKVAHGFAGIVEAYGGPCPVCGNGPYELMSNHCKRSHPEYGFQTVSDPYIWARDNGDPHGAYAAKLEQVGSLDPKEEFNKLRDKESKYDKSKPAKKKAAAKAS